MFQTMFAMRRARATMLNCVGCALGGSSDQAVDISIRALESLFRRTHCECSRTRRARFDPLHASLINSISSHVYDYDDTTPKNYMHPTSPVASALAAYASASPVTGRDFMQAFILGFEAEMRIGNAVYPSHYDVGWHITGTAGVFGAATAIGKLLGLPVQQMVWAMGLAATQAAGLREMFGSMAKAFHPGRSAQNGYTAALQRKRGFERGVRNPARLPPRSGGGVRPVENHRGISVDYELQREYADAFPCGIVNHPTIDGCIQLHREHGIPPEAIAAVRLRVAPLVMDLCNQTNI